MTVVAIVRSRLLPATCGAKPRRSKDSRLSREESPFYDPATNAAYTDLGKRFSARRWATATDSNHLLAITSPFPTQCDFTRASNSDPSQRAAMATGILR